MVCFHTVYDIIYCKFSILVLFLFGKLSVGTLHNFLSESHFKSGDIEICSHDRKILNFSSQKAPVVALKSNLIHFNEVLFWHCPAVFIPDVTLIVHFCYFVVENLTGLFYFTLAVAYNDVLAYPLNRCSTESDLERHLVCISLKDSRTVTVRKNVILNIIFSSLIE